MQTRRDVLSLLAVSSLLGCAEAALRPGATRREPTCARCGHRLWGSGDSFDSTDDGVLCQECVRGTPEEREAALCSACGVTPATYFADAPHAYWPSYWDDAWESDKHYWEGTYADPDQRCGDCARARVAEVRAACRRSAGRADEAAIGEAD